MKKLYSFLILAILLPLAINAQYSGKYSHKVTVYNNLAIGLTNMPALVVFDTKTQIAASKMKSDGSDIRFSTDACLHNPSYYDYWIENGINTDTTYLWVRIPSIGAMDSAVIYLFYGDNGASAQSSFTSTFPSSYITSGSTTISGTHSYGWFEIKSGDTVTISNNSPFSLLAGAVRINGGLKGVGKGYQPGSKPSDGNGPGAGKKSSTNAAGAGGGGYGGDGGDGGYDAGDPVGAGGTAYGSMTNDSIEVGSSGGTTAGQFGGAGGGAVKIQATSVMVGGKILMDGGQADQPGGGQGAGGGSGGGILILANRIKVTGKLSATGGDGSVGTSTANDDGGGGGGGRIKVFFAENVSVPSSTVVVTGGKGGPNGTTPGENGDNGSLFAKTIAARIVKIGAQGAAGKSTWNIYKLCQGDSVLIKGTYYSSTIFLADTFKMGDCDSIVAWDVTVNPKYLTQHAKTICQGDSILLIGKYRKTAGVYYDSLQTVAKCDSVIIYTLVVNPKYAISQAVGICPGGSIVLGGQLQKFPGTFIDSFKTTQGCDSIITSTLTFNPEYSNSRNVRICQGDSMLLGGKYRKTVGVYYDSLKTNKGCDSVIISALQLNPQYFSSLSAAICPGQSRVIGGIARTTAGVYYDSLKSKLGCDSVIQTTLSVNLVYSSSRSEAICQGESIMIGGQARTVAGAYNDSFKTVKGCDSVITVNLTVNTVNAAITSNGNTLTASLAGAAYQWVRCDLSYAAIAGATSQSYTVTKDGDFGVFVTANSCMDTSNCINVVFVGVPSVTMENVIKVYPNPASGMLHISVEANAGKGVMTATLLNTLGQVAGTVMLEAGKIQSINVEGLAKGIYYLQIEAGEVLKVQKIVVD